MTFEQDANDSDSQHSAEDRIFTDQACHLVKRTASCLLSVFPLSGFVDVTDSTIFSICLSSESEF
jgi:hypothetical protein